MPIADVSNKKIHELISLQGKTAVITGGARGIGLAIARRFLEAGAKAVIADNDPKDYLPKALAELQGLGEAVGLKLDTRDARAMEKAAEEAVSRFGGLDIWVNDAGIFPSTPFFAITEEEMDAVIDTNVKGVFHGSRAAARQMKNKGKGGVILNISSVTGLNGSEGYAHYSPSKYAVRGMTATLAKELGEHNIRVLGIAPTLIDTPGVRERKPEMDEKVGGDTFKKHAEENPLKRIGVPDDIARVALFAVSDLALFMTGTTLVVDGGDLSQG